MKRSRFLAATLLLCAGCRTLPFPDPDLEGDYGRALKKWTRKVALYSGLETRAFVRVVYHSPEFVVAQATELSRMRAERPDKAAETLARLREENRPPSFFAVVYIPDRTANDWNEPNSVWRIAVNIGLGEYPPRSVTRYERPFNAELRALYPYLDEYSVGYVIRFPDPSEHARSGQPPPTLPANYRPAEVEMIAAGAIGKMFFRWRMDGKDGAEAEPGRPEGPPESPKP